MLGKTDPQENFFDSYVKDNFLPEEHELLQIKEKVDFSFIEKETEGLYSKGSGRPSYPPEVMFKILFLEFYYNLSDVEVVKQLKFNVLFRYFVGLKVEDSIPDDTSLVVFRKRLTEEEFERIFDIFVMQCKEKGLLQEKLKLIDATHIIADVAIPNTTNFLQEGRKKALIAIARERKDLDEHLQKYIPKKLCRKPTKEDLAQELVLSKGFIKEVRGKYSSKVERIIDFLERATDPTGKRKLVSLVDPDARFGRKRNKKFAGYKAHIVEDESQIVTSIETIPGNENEGSGENVENLLKKEDAKKLKAKGVVCDSLYDSVLNRLSIDKRGMKHYIPDKRKNKKLYDFIYNKKEDELICKKGYSSIGKIRQGNGYRHYFSSIFCKDCNRKKECSSNKNRVMVYVSDDYLLQVKIDPQEKTKALKKRGRIEAKFGEAKRHHALLRARYRGRWRVAIQVFMTFTVMNLKRMVKLLKVKENSVKLALSSG